MSDPNDNSIPVLHEILVPGHDAQARQAEGDAPATGPAPEAGTPQEPGFRREPTLAPQSTHPDEPTLSPEPVLASQPVLTPEQTRSPQPALAPEPAFAPQAADAAEATLASESLHATEHAHPKRRSRLHHGAAARHAHDDALAASAGFFDRAEPVAPLEAGTIVPPDIAQETGAPSQPDLDADAIAERLHGRFAGFLSGEGRGVVEARCRDALQEHASSLVSQITREVAMTLEAEMTGWVREAVEEEIARRSGRG
ncbi:conserved hypothetical protein [Paraburkholderia ribeironis]|uniref:DUF2486 domain-containing protein n=1 Tax=Paraburkholderia ribeironis TaxID=1247936 RepID=A0A1N7SN14_9BURK|nr:DUF2486 family protein [Paraburkholderia ribeironis]SIT48834.1 conserved hypothetical protein [Paraburkholderia ribeironis]